MLKRLIGVWFSLVLLVLLLCSWLGYKAATRIANEYFRRHEQATAGRLSPALRTLLVITFLRMGIASNPEKLRSALVFETEHLETFVRDPLLQDVSSVVKLDLAIAYVELSIVENRLSNASAARAHMQSGQDLFRSLGWQDYSEEAVKPIAQKELNRWTVTAKK